MNRTIANTYDAWWFLMEHPKFQIPSRNELTPEEAAVFKSEYAIVIQDRNGNYWSEWAGVEHTALTENLGIHYAKVNGQGVVGRDKSKNVAIACWLEFGELLWENPNPYDNDGRDQIIHCHDIDLDCGAATFDAALVKLAGLVVKKYGDYPMQDWLNAPERETETQT